MKGIVEGVVMPMLRERAPKLAQDISRSFEALLDDTSEIHQLPPYELYISVYRVEDEALVEVYSKGGEVLRTLDAKELLEQILATQLDQYNIILQQAIKWMLGDEKMSAQILEVLRQGSLKIQYNDEDELDFYTVREGTEELIDIQEFFTTL